jgi:GT2 family glycosyltransferase
MQTDLSIIIVSWNVWDLLRASLHSIEAMSRPLANAPDVRAFGPATLGASAPTLEVVVVDNASHDATATLLPARFGWVRFIRSAANLGFTAGNNVGYATSRGRTIFFLNPDTEFVHNVHAANAPSGENNGSDPLWTLYRALLENPHVGMVGPQLRNADNSLQNSRRRLPTPLDAFLDAKTLGRYWRNNPWLRRYHMHDWPTTFRHEVDWITGAAMLARRTALEEIRQPQYAGPFDEDFFMYSEEVDLCKRLGEAGWQILYVPEAVVIHYEAQSSGQIVKVREFYFQRSMIHYYQKHFGATWAAVLRHFLLWNMRGQLLIEATKWLLGHKRPLRASRIQTYRKLLATGLRRDAPLPQ